MDVLEKVTSVWSGCESLKTTQILVLTLLRIIGVHVPSFRLSSRNIIKGGWWYPVIFYLTFEVMEPARCGEPVISRVAFAPISPCGTENSWTNIVCGRNGCQVISIEGRRTKPRCKHFPVEPRTLYLYSSSKGRSKRTTKKLLGQNAIQFHLEW